MKSQQQQHCTQENSEAEDEIDERKESKREVKRTPRLASWA